MRHCDTCSKIIPIGDNNRINVEFNGKFAVLLTKLYGDHYLEFCSLSCFNKFKIPESDNMKQKETKP